VFPLAINTYEGLARVRGLIYLQVSISGQALIFVTRARRVSWLEMPHPLVLCSFLLAQMGATFIAVYGTCLLKVQFFFLIFFVSPRLSQDSTDTPDILQCAFLCLTGHWD